MGEYIKPGIRASYVYQDNVLMCWAGVGLTMWRSRHGKGGPGHSLDELFARQGGGRYLQILNYIALLNEELGGGMDLSRLPTAEATVRGQHPEFRNVPSGLPDTWADGFFTWLGCRSDPLDATVSASDLKAMIRNNGPIAIFTRNPGHLQILVGYWEAAGHEDKPQVILFNPERYILEMERRNDPSLDPSVVREDRLLWEHWQAYYCGNLVDGKGWHY
ncbi:MAG: hypothetical protein GC186_09300 [Rhodobacteraceae bacterium]|nr:hypothetical protein [Paracoccaceae bacterium]